ncbi:MAG: pyruvate kinase [Cyclobacteriaceae bacterium]|nr:pyruvate kinase [Cyclobacteriaceae bacterium]UYN85375.1 MAG: pyruvate kinase [Cyclobacteriaceae bacterium]
MNIYRSAINHERIVGQLETLAADMKHIEDSFRTTLENIHISNRISAVNLIHYLVLRTAEIRQVQEYLHQIGLSSLTSCESHVLSQLSNVLRWLSPTYVQRDDIACTFETAGRIRQEKRELLLGADPYAGRPHIMVTLSAEVAHDRMHMEEILLAGMTVARINCAHDGPDTWLQMINTLKKSVAKTGIPCKIYMDLAGPKIRIKSITFNAEQQDKLRVKEQDQLCIVGNLIDATLNEKIVQVEPAEIVSMIKPGEHVFIDDGKFEAKVLKAGAGKAIIQIVRISTKKPFLRLDKGINLPDSELSIDSLTASDLSCIPFICKHADMVGYSFVGTPYDLERLRNELRKHGSENKLPAIILKIERLLAIQNLPGLLLTGMRDESMGVMIARGDLAVEIGFERLSEIQEEILWICEAAHAPVIWATQVLESLNKTGFATRSEMTDAAMGVMAECVMLNKGTHMVKTIQVLDNILKRQIGHVDKKRYIMRPLGIAKNFLDETRLMEKL